MPGEFFFFGFASFLSPLFGLILLLIVAVAIGSTRRQPDPQGRRLTATFLCVVLFLSLFTALFAATAAMGSFMDLTRTDDEVSFDIGADDGGGDFEDFEGEEEGDFPDDDGGGSSDEDAVGDAVQALLVAAVAVGVLLYHRRRLIELTEEEGFRDGPAATVFSAYLYTTSLLGLVAFVVGASMALYGFAQVVAPGALSSDEADFVREEGGRQLFTGAFLALAALAIVVVHQRERGRLDEPTADEDPIA